ncbi:hypothetical protein WDW37_18715 [Bdellovibrionota bacterium FG-1]
MSWLASEAHQIHAIFYGLFYALITVFLLLGIFIEYFKWPLGQMPSFSVLIGRVLIATLLLHSYSEVSNTIADVVDAFSAKLGDLNQLNLVLSKMGDKLGQFSLSWVSVKETLVQIISFLTFFFLYLAVHAIQAFMLYTWTLLYVFSPLLIALYVLPSTAGATKALYRSLIEVSCWKIVLSVLATLLWSFALSNINKPDQNVPFATVIFLNLILAGSLLLVPMVVHALAGSGFEGLAQSAGGIVAGATMAAPLNAFASAYAKGKKAYQTTSRLQERFFSKSPTKGSK